MVDAPDGTPDESDGVIRDLKRQIAELRAEVETLRQEESCHDEEIHGWERDFEQERNLRVAAEAENARLKALPLKDEVERVVEALATVEEWQKWALTWAGSAFLSGETISPDDMTETEYKSELYSGMCKLSNHMTWLRDEIAAPSKQEPVAGGRKRIDDALVSCAALIRALASDDIARVAAGELDYVRTAIGEEGGWRPTHRHVRRGSEYVLIGIGRMQCDWWQITGAGYRYPVDMAEVAIYRSVDDGSLWVRPREEFEDGRFEVLTASGETGR
jgi:hypothetical protein